MRRGALSGDKARTGWLEKVPGSSCFQVTRLFAPLLFLGYITPHFGLAARYWELRPPGPEPFFKT